MGKGKGRPADWCILRCAARNTLRLAETLGAAGFEVWTPVEVQDRRAHRRSTAKVERSVPISPTFVFARARHITDLFRARLLPVSPYPGFTIFAFAGRVPLVSDLSMDGLRREEERTRAVREAEQRKTLRAPTFATGTPVQVDQPAFAGLGGRVESQDGRDVLVCFGGHWRVKIDAWLILPDGVEGAPALEATAVEAA